MMMVHDALAEPFHQLCFNAGVDSDEALEQVIEMNDPNYGLNAKTLEFGDLIEQGVIDPAKVVKNSLETAASIAGLVLTTEVLVAEV
jgi:chaperonin GroEL